MRVDEVDEGKKLHSKQTTGGSSAKLNSTRLEVAFMGSDNPCSLSKMFYFIRSGVRMISSGDISLNLNALYVS